MRRVTDQQEPPVRLRPEILALPAYKQGRAASANAFKLSSNENPFDPLPSVLAKVREVDDFNRYPDAAATALRSALAARYAVGIDEVIVGAGSVAVIAQLISAAAGPGDEIVYAWRSFEAYPSLVTTAGATSVRVPLRPDDTHDLDAMAQAVTERTRMVIVCSPNNPTGTVATADDVESFLTQVPRDVLVLLDEAYVEFVGDERAVDGTRLLAAHPNLVLARTFSKAYGLAGLRVGYAIGHARILDAARSTAIPLSVTRFAEAAAVASLEHSEELLERANRIMRLRDDLWRAVLDQGWTIPESQANFLWFETRDETARAAEVFERAGVIVRAFPQEGIRVSIGDASSVDKLLSAAGEIVRSLPEGHPARRIS
ncbi:histidinol-phosphate transaminase [Rathayibacter iranicus]|uniref:Aromatic amino acid aminotransferase n=2 Tax=Rathayibacter iranicus TaxID=59737 RepID=A0AAD1AG03_9MICO|nr:histidinol-phosphate transaminase [Rathayibacter iranicus]MWV32172.1 histidinol-phosphate transaminase [Rathayibacter iranicus NCPPB 2253 = VKM Ac-1602]PPI45548.1 histidinol-phosphate transaminase [Rathayibacter iranicus]PPI59368.1 histidinol-phosphate transaminase [Rathayibacter iranicus]PPI70450.1 histidinol-phosphate transaminase [Rathayibacter iranicus]